MERQEPGIVVNLIILVLKENLMMKMINHI